LRSIPETSVSTVPPGKESLLSCRRPRAAVKSLGNVATPAGTHTLAVDSNTHSVWIAFAKGEDSYVAELKSPIS